MSKSGNKVLAQDRELELALVRLKAQCPEECALLLGRLKEFARQCADGAAQASAGALPGSGDAARFLLGAYRVARDAAAALDEADGLEPPPEEPPKYARSIDK